MQEKPDVVAWSFEACGILNCLDSEVCLDEPLERQLYLDRDDELDDPFSEAETLTSDSDV